MAELLGLAVRRYNMYQTGKVISFPTEGEKVLVRDKITYQEGLFDSTYKVKINDTIWGIAYSVYKSTIGNNASKYWWVIADANNIHNPLDLNYLIGTDLNIPSISNIELTT